MYKEYLGENYHNGIRVLLSVREDICPDNIIDEAFTKSPIQKMMVAKAEETVEHDVLALMGRYYMAAILCVHLKKEHHRNWDSKIKKCIGVGNRLMAWL